MSRAISIALLLLSATVVESLREQTGDEEDFLPQLEQKKVVNRAEEIVKDGHLEDLCGGCKSLVTKVKKKMGEDTSKANVEKLVKKVCSKGKDEEMEKTCKKITGKVKDDLIDAVADGGDPKSVCQKVNLCKKKPRPRL